MLALPVALELALALELELELELVVAAGVWGQALAHHVAQAQRLPRQARSSQ